MEDRRALGHRAARGVSEAKVIEVIQVVEVIEGTSLPFLDHLDDFDTIDYVSFTRVQPFLRNVSRSGA
jgi:hypothetical protein